ncbi:ABC transporter permease [Microvirga antarctica]|uniref:ABC transporter permease n=1 Tax=Microvirga antarctica TaxID=2819233 RepID=UPI001B307CDF|nr:ABC transporter permease [Microvirga antarctica]
MNQLVVSPALRKSEEPRGWSAEVWRRFKRHRASVVGLVVLIVLALLSLFAPLISPFAFDAQDIELLGTPTAPNATHWLGTDQLGRDNFTRLLYGGQISFSVGLAAALVASAIGATVGAIAGFYRGWVDVVLMRVTDILLSIPPLPLILLLSGLVRPSVPTLILIIGALGWMSTARIIRSEFLSLREREFVQSARAIGSTNGRLIWLHILPNAIAPLIVATTLAVGHSILVESALSFLGFGVHPPTPSWGNLLNEARQWLDSAPWLAIPPGAMIFATMLAVNFIGDGLRDALDFRN